MSSILRAKQHQKHPPARVAAWFCTLWSDQLHPLRRHFASPHPEPPLRSSSRKSVFLSSFSRVTTHPQSWFIITIKMASTRLLEEFLALVPAGHLAEAKETGAASDAVLASITPHDALLVIDMQYDFLPGGAFGVAEGDATVPTILTWMRRFADVQATVVCTRDYHPVDHCSFNTHGGPFPPHCVQGSRGSELIPPIAEALRPLIATGNGSVVFKGFSPAVDSFGAAPYDESRIGTRVTACAAHRHCGASWTGAFSLFCSRMAEDCNAPPDVMAVLDRVPLREYLDRRGATGRIFVVGLALDFCVLDSAVNLAVAANGRKLIVVAAGCRAAHIPGVGKHGSGFLSDPAEVCRQLRQHAVDLLL